MDGSAKHLIIRRLFCSQCSHIHHELPETIVPYKRYSSEVIESVISAREKIPSYPCEESTARRIRIWFSLLRSYLESVIESLKLIYKQELALLAFLDRMRLSQLHDQSNGWLKALVRIVVNSGYWIQTRSE